MTPTSGPALADDPAGAARPRAERPLGRADPDWWASLPEFLHARDAWPLPGADDPSGPRGDESPRDARRAA